MDFVNIIGENYLWVNSLCIVQDDYAEKGTEIKNMAGIYSNASLAIIAADAPDAYNGLFGLEGISRSRTSKQNYIYAGPRL